MTREVYTLVQTVTALTEVKLDDLSKALPFKGS